MEPLFTTSERRENNSQLENPILKGRYKGPIAISYVDIAGICHNSITVISMLLVIMISLRRRRRKMSRPQQKVVTEVKKEIVTGPVSCDHVSRTIILLILSLLWTLNMAETLIRWHYSTTNISFLIVLSPLSSFLTTLVTLKYLYYVESLLRISTCYSALPLLSWVGYSSLPILSWVGQLGLVSTYIYKVLIEFEVRACTVAASLYILTDVALFILVTRDIIAAIIQTILRRPQNSKSAGNETKEDNHDSCEFRNGCNNTSRLQFHSCQEVSDKMSYLPREILQSTTPAANINYTPSGIPEVEESSHAAVTNNKEPLLRYRHDESSFLSRCSFWWYTEILRLGWKRPLEFQDLDKIPDKESSKHQYEKFYRHFISSKNVSANGEPPLWRVFLSCYWRPLLFGGFLKFLGDAVNIVGPLAISPIVSFVRNIHEDTLQLRGDFIQKVYFVGWGEFLTNGWVLAWVAFIASLLQTSFSQASSHILACEGIHVRSALQSMVYAKSLRIAHHVNSNEKNTEDMTSDRTKDFVDAARVINLTSVDADNILGFFLHCHYIWAIPLKVAVLVGILWLQLGISAVYSTLFAIVFLIPTQFFLAKCIAAVNKIFVTASDDRLRETHQVLSMIRTIKVNVWEKNFLERVLRLRDVELKLLLKDSLLRACMTFLTQASGIVIILLAFGFYAVLSEVPPEEGTLFSSLALFSQLTVPLFILPLIVAYSIKAMSSTTRFEKFFGEPETSAARRDATFSNNCENAESTITESEDIAPHKESVVRILPQETDNHVFTDSKDSYRENEAATSETSVIARITEGYFSCSSASEKSFVLENINLIIPKGKLTVVVGGVGSGKTSLLMGLLGEIPLVSGDMKWNGNPGIALVSQNSWLLNCSVKENILFFKTYQRQRYEKVLKACALKPDINILPERDETEIGERGINLSGGQRQRVAIARALYSGAPVIIMDCPFSALDNTVANHVFNEGILGFILTRGQTTVVLATQQTHWCQFADKVVYLEDKTIKQQGTPEEVLSLCPYLLSRKHTNDEIAAGSPPVDIWKERNSLKRHVSRMSIQHSTSKKNLQNTLTEVEINESFLRALPLRRKLSYARSSPLHYTLLPGDEIEGLLTATSSRKKKKTQPMKSAVCRSTSSTPAFFRTHNDAQLREKSTLNRTALPPKRHKSMPTQKLHSNIRTDRDSSVLRKLLSSKSIRTAESTQKKVHKGDFSFKRSLKRFLAPEDGPMEPDAVDEADHEAVDDDGEPYETGIDDEERERGRISNRNYVSYLKACGWGLGTLYLLFSFLNQGVSILLDVWLGQWSDQTTESNVSCPGINITFRGSLLHQLCGQVTSTTKMAAVPIANGAENVEQNNQVYHHLLIFALLSGVAVLVGLLTILLAQAASHRGRRVLHHKMLLAVVGSKIKFFDETPLGRMMNRFSSDTSMIDKELGWSIMHLVFFALLCASAILVDVVVSPVFIIVTIPLCLAYYFIQRIFRCTSRELKRLESLSRSPVLGLITESCCSPAVIRAFGMEDKFFATYMRRIDAYLGPSILLHAGNRWLGLSLDYMGSLIVYLATVACLAGSTLHVGDFLRPATVGLAIKYTLTIPVYLNWLVRFLSDTEMCMNSVERVRQYSFLDQETNMTDKEKNIKKSSCRQLHYSLLCRCRRKDSVVTPEDTKEFRIHSPSAALKSSSSQTGQLEFRQVSLFYDKKCAPVLLNASFSVSSGQKVGICGRTGSGKSTLLLGILRLMEQVDGKIFLNGIDTDTLSLDCLRRHISVVLQEDCVFSGTIRFNIDPESLYDDDVLWEVLELVSLKDYVSSLPLKLDTELGEGFAILSAGQIQLLTLSRVFLSKKSVILLDEITSNLDARTEKHLMMLLKRELPHSTVLAVSHSVPFLLETDRVLVIDEGKVVEDGHPTQLINDSGSRLYSFLQSVNKYFSRQNDTPREN